MAKNLVVAFTAWKVSKYGVISGPYFSVFGLNTGKYGPEITPYLDTFHASNKILNFVKYVEIESCSINKTFLLEKFTNIFFWSKPFHWFSLLIYSKWTRMKIWG